MGIQTMQQHIRLRGRIINIGGSSMMTKSTEWQLGFYPLEFLSKVLNMEGQLVKLTRGMYWL